MVTSWAKYDTGCSHQMRLVAGQRWLTVSFGVSSKEFVLTEKDTFDQAEARRKHHGIHPAILI